MNHGVAAGSLVLLQQYFAQRLKNGWVTLFFDMCCKLDKNLTKESQQVSSSNVFLKN